MAFGIEGQYRMAVTIDKFEDFLKEDKFLHFTLIENIGLSLPYWELKFDCVFPELLRYLNEKQSITVQLGTSMKDLEPIQLVIKKPIIVPQTASCSTVTLRGFLDMQAYLDNEVKASYPNSTTDKLASTIAQKYGLTFKSNAGTMNDMMTYYQPGMSDYKFLYTEWLHSYLADNDIVVPAITSKSELTYNSVTKMVSEFDATKDVVFVDYAPEEKNEIQVDANTGLESNTTMSNMFGNYMKERDIFDQDLGVLTSIKVENNTPLISESKTTSVDESISRSSGFFVQSTNVHKNYYKQELVNTQKFFSLQASKQWVSAPNSLVQKAYPGSLAMFMTKKANGQVNDQTSGLYLVSKRVVSIKNRKVHTNFLLTRENMNYSL